ncbi:MAG TPA: Rne/Rng family ribonuclease [Actinomycetales bacterium]|nr:Rne/Rng family ribonuclease [Actinomycetales bacterium]
MTDSSTTDNAAQGADAAAKGAGDDTSQASAPRARRRAASRPAGPPAAEPAPEGAGGQQTEQESRPAAKRARASRAKKAPAAPAAALAQEPDAGTGAGGQAEPSSDGDETAAAPPAKRAARKRATKATAAGQASADAASTEDAAGDATAGGTQPTSSAPVADEPAPEGGGASTKPARKRATRSRKAAAASAQAATDQAVTDQPTTDQSATEPAQRPALPGAADDAPGSVLTGVGVPVVRGAQAESDDEQTDERGGGLAAAAVLFQAPEPAAAPRRRRRATSPAGPVGADTEATAESAQDREGRPERADDESTESGEDDAAQGSTDEQDDEQQGGRKRRRRGGRGRRRRGDGDSQSGDGEDGEGQGASGGRASTSDEADRGEADASAGDHDEAAQEQDDDHGDEDESGSSSRRRRRRRRRSGSSDTSDEAPNGSGRSRNGRRGDDEVASVKGSTRLEAKKQRRRDGREAGRRKQIITESEFLARRESVERTMIVRERSGRTQIAVLEDDVLVEHYVANETNSSMIGNVYLGRVQNVLPSMEAAFVDIGKGRNAVLYAGEVNWDAAGLEGQPRRIEQALKSGDTVLVQVTKDPLGHKGARLTSQVSLPGRYLVYVPNSSMTGISRKLPDTERSRLKKILKTVVPEHAGVIVRTAAEGATEEELARDVTRLTQQWEEIQAKAGSSSGGSAPKLLHGEPDLTIRVVRDVFNEDFAKLVVSGAGAWDVVQPYLQQVAPDLADRASRWTAEEDVFVAHRIDEQLAKAMDRKVYLPSGGSLVIDRTEAMTVVDVNTGKFTGSGGNLEETVTRNNLEAAEEIVRQLRLRDIGGIIVVDFIDMVLESNRDLVLRRLVECLGRDRTKHQVAEVTSLGLVQMTRKRVGQGLLEVFSEPCDHCHGRGIIVHSEPVSKNGSGNGSGNGHGSGGNSGNGGSGRSRRGKGGSGSSGGSGSGASSAQQPPRGPIPAGLVASLARHADHHDDEHHDGEDHEGEHHEEPTGEAAVALLSASTTQDGSQTAVAADRPADEAPVDEAPVEQAPVDAAAAEPAPDEQPQAVQAPTEEPEAPAAKPRRRRRAASAPAGPPAKHDTVDERPHEPETSATT